MTLLTDDGDAQRQHKTSFPNDASWKLRVNCKHLTYRASWNWYGSVGETVRKADPNQHKRSNFVNSVASSAVSTIGSQKTCAVLPLSILALAFGTLYQNTSTTIMIYCSFGHV